MKPAHLFSSKQLIVALLFSLIVGGVLTHYIGHYEQAALTPLRNLIVVGQLNVRSSEEIGVTKYAHGEGINPVHIAQLSRYTALQILNGENNRQGSPTEDEIARLLQVADFLIERSHDRQHLDVPFTVWQYDFDFPYYGLTAPWLSGMAQGHIIEVMLAAFDVTGNEQYLSTARRAANALSIPIDEGGTAIDLGEGAIWFEEYAQPGVAPPRVLNGHNYSLFGLMHLCDLDEAFCSLYDSGVAGLEQTLPAFDAAAWSRYDLVGTAADPKYQRIHVEQLAAIHEATGKPIFAEYAQRFQRQIILPFGAFYRLTHRPGEFIVLLYIGNTFMVFILTLIVIHTRQQATEDEHEDLSHHLNS